LWTHTRPKARGNISAPRAAGSPHVSAYLRINETRDLKDAVGDLLVTDRCALQLIVFLGRFYIRVFQGKGPVGREDTSDSHTLSVSQHDTICTEVRALIHVTVGCTSVHYMCKCVLLLFR
jgi:hypothetical protein